MSTVLKRVFANPSVTPGIVIVLLAVGAVLWFNGGRALAEDLLLDWQIKRAQHWAPEPWALTAEDFPGHDAEEMPAERITVSREDRPEWTVEASRLPGLEQLFYITGRIGTSWTEDAQGNFVLDNAATESVAGTTVGEVDVYSYVSAPEDLSYSTPERADLLRVLRKYAMDAPRQLLGSDPAWPLEGPFWDQELLSIAYVGHRPSEQELIDTDGEPFDAGGPGYFGLVSHHRDSAGDEFRTTTLATVAEGALVVVGVVAPEGVEPDADLEPALLLERLATEVRADPPVSDADSVRAAGS